MTRHRIGYTLWPASFELIDLAPYLDEAEALGVDTVEIPFFCTRLIANGEILEPAIRRFESQTEGRSVGFSTHAMLTVNLMDVAERLPVHERIARANIDLTARLGANRMVLHCGLTDAETQDGVEDAYSRQRESLARLGEYAERQGVMICVETIWSFDGRTTALPSRLAEEISRIGQPAVKATIDYAHAALQCELHGADFMDEIRAIAPVSHHIHLNDCFGLERDMPIALPSEAVAYGSGDLHLPIGWGGLDWERLMTEPDYPDTGLILNQELHPTFWYALPDDVAEMRRLAKLMDRVNVPG